MSRVLIFLLSFLYFSINVFAQSTLSENQLKFIPNKGQWHPDVKFKAELKEGKLLVFDTKLRYEFYNAEQLAELQHQLHSNTKPTNTSIDAHAFEIKFLNAQVPDSISGHDTFSDKRNYIYPEGNFSNINCYNKVKLHNIYNGVDLVLFQKNGSLKYEFHVQRKTPTDQIQLAFSGQDSIYIENEYLFTKTSVNAIAEEPPYAYQTQGDLYNKVECHFNLEGNILSYNLGEYDYQRPLVIDPQLIFSTYSGSTADNWGNTACLDNKGNLYTGGTVFRYRGGTFSQTGSGRFPSTIGAFQQTFQGGDTDIGILKFDSSGVNLEYATYIGGNGSEIPTSTITNEKGELYILGITSSTNIPTSSNATQNQLSPNLPTVYWTKNNTPIGTGTTVTSSVLPNDTITAYSIGSSRCNPMDTILSEQYIIKPKLDDIYIIGDSLFCNGDSLSFNINSNGTNSISSVLWKLNNSTIDSNIQVTIKSPNDKDNLTAIIKYLNCKGDTITTSKNIQLHLANNLNSSITLNITKDSTLCTNQVLQLTSTPLLGGANPTIDWYLDDVKIDSNKTNITYSSTERGKLYAKLTSSLQCLNQIVSFSDSTSIDTLQKQASPTLSLRHNKVQLNDAECVKNISTNITFDYLGTSNTYFWFTNNIYQGSSTSPNVTIPVNENDTLTVSIFSNNGCLRGQAITSEIATLKNVNSESININEISYCDSTIQLKAKQTGGSYASDTNWIPVGGYSFNRTTDLIVLHLSVDGSQLLHSTYLGGSSNDGVIYKGDPLTLNYGDQLRGDINIDDNGYVYIASTTSSSDFPTKNAVQPIYGGGRSDAVLVKLSPDFSSLDWSTFIGGDKMETGMSVKRDKSNNVYIAGGTTSQNFVAKSSLPEFSLGKGDAYLSKYSSDGQTLINSIKLGTPEIDQAYFLEIDDNDDLYLLGQTFGKYPTKNIKYTNPNSGLFVQKITSTFDSTIYSTVIGDLDSTDKIKPIISPTAFLVNECQNIFIAGWGGAVNSSYPTQGLMNNMPTTSNAFQRTTDGSDFYLMALLENSDSLLYATYFGGSTSEEHVDGGTSRFDEKGIVYQSVCAGCGSNDDFPKFPTPDNNPNTYPQSNGSLNCNNGVFKFDLAHLRADMEIPTGCRNLEVTIKNSSVGGSEFKWDFGDGSADTIRFDTNAITHTFPKSGTYTITLTATDLTTCQKESIKKTITTVHKFVPAQTFSDTFCLNEVKQIQLQIADTDQFIKWSNSNLLSNDTITNPIILNPIAGKTRFTVEVSDTLGCNRVDTVDVYISDIQPINYTDTFCLTDNKQLTIRKTEIDSLFDWNPKTGLTIYNSNVTLLDTIARELEYFITIEDTLGCERIENYTIKAEARTPKALYDTLCQHSNTTINYIPDIYDILFNWKPKTGLNNYSITTPIITDSLINNTIYYITVTNDLNCKREDTLHLTIDKLFPNFSYVKLGECKLNGTPLISFNNKTKHNFPVTYQWKFGDGESSTEINPTNKYNKEGLYTINLQANSPYCKNQFNDTITISPINIPNIITPNNDGKNDVFTIKGIEETGDWKFELHNRWGKLLYEDKQYKNDYTAEGVRDGLYYYLITAPDQTTCKGWVDITR